jgi:LacI family transcriptional regulator
MISDSTTPVSHASITDVAAMAGVSTATVSRVINGQRAQNDGIARRVLKAADALHYSANNAASTLRSNVTHLLGLILPDPHQAFAAELLAELEPAIEHAGLQLLVGIGPDAQTQHNRIAAMATRKVDGLVIVPPDDAQPDPELEALARTMPIVQISGPVISSRISWVGIDQSAAMQIALDHLSAHNAGAVAFFGDTVDSDDAAERYMTFQTSMSMRNMDSEPAWTTFGPSTVTRGYDDAMALFTARGRRPDSIICSSDAIAAGALIALHELGVHIPDEVCIIGAGDSTMAQALHPSLSSLRPPIAPIVKATLRLMHKGPTGKRWLPSHTAFPPQLIERQSTATPRFGSSDMEFPGIDPG